MLWIIVSIIVVSLLSIWLGHKHFLYLDDITPRNLSYTLLGVLFVFLVLRILHFYGYFPEAVAGAFMANVYASLFGFFAGSAWQQYRQKVDSGKILYVNRSFWTDILPGIVAIGVILFGIQRTSVFSDLPFTPIRVTSGLSIMAVGFYGLTIRLVPEIRRKGLILLDRKIDWDDFISYSWYSENVIEIDYRLHGKITTFKTMIPEEDQLHVERILADKMAEKIEKEEFDEYEELE